MSDAHSNNSALTPYMIFNKTRANSLSDVKILNMWGYNLKNISIFQSMPNVEIVSLSLNQISTLRDFSSCLKLRELLLRHNLISDLSEVQYLSHIDSLRRLWLAENPISKLPNYRSYIISILPQLEILDEKKITEDERKCSYYQDTNAYQEPQTDILNNDDDDYQYNVPQIPIDTHKHMNRPRMLPKNFNADKTNRRKQRFLDNHIIQKKEEIDPKYNNMSDEESIDYANAQQNYNQQQDDEARLTAVLALLPGLSANSISIVLETISQMYQ